MLEVETPVLTKQHFSESRKIQRADATGQSSPDAAFNPEVYFDRWLADVNRNGHRFAAGPGPGEEIYFESARGSKCEVTFEGVLHFDGYTVGNIRSPEGTLVLAKAGRVDADIDVGKAVISGSVTGNINAPEGVILDSDARVTGQIHTRMLSVRVGALFEGDCLFAAAPRSPGPEESTGVEWLDKH
jgi:cytoskeletal protein CcmA (bactofilin family)